MSDSMPEKFEKTYWIPLESNPTMLSSFAAKMGMPKEFQFSDCFGLDEELLAFVPRPCLGIVLLFPYRRMKELGGGKKFEKEKVEESVYWMKQLVGNACGTIAVLHLLLNQKEKLKIPDDSFVSTFFKESKELSAVARGELLSKQEKIEEIATEVAKGGQTEAPEAEEKVDYHFIAFVEKEGKLYELDGGKEGAIYHGETTEANFVNDAAKIIKSEFMEKLPDEMRFSVITLGPPPQ